MQILLNIFEFIKTRGVSDQHLEDNKMTILLNTISFLTSFGALSIFLMARFLTIDYVYMKVSLGVSITYFFMVVLHHFHKIRWAKLYFSTIAPFWYLLAILFIGGHFGQSIATAATVVITYLLFKEEIVLRNSLILLNIVYFVLPTLYINFYPPLMGVRDYPIDEIIVFLLCLGWISIVFSIYEGKTDQFIRSLKEKNAILEQKTAELERFTYIASHDLKSPIRNIVSFLSLMKRDLNAGNHENLEEYVDFAETGAYQMNELIVGILEFTKVDQHHDTKVEQIDFNKSMEKVLLNLQQDIEQKNAEIIIDPLPSYLCREHDFVIVFQNIIQNGLKYNENPIPKVHISYEENSTQHIIHIEDNGIGIKEEYYERIFEFFRRLHTTQEYPGTGIGLGLCKKITEKYGGYIDVVSEEGKYSIFTISLPKLQR